jgi:hypothetical protein
MQIKMSGAQGILANYGLPISLNFTIRGRVRGPISQQGLQNALERLREIHPMLAVRMDPGDQEHAPCFTTEGVPAIPLRMVERISDDQWADEVEHEITIPTNYRTGPLFRVVWLKGAEVSDLLLVCDHITADGLAGIYALRDLLRLLSEPELRIDPCPPERLADVVPEEMRQMIDRLVSASADNSRNMFNDASGVVDLPPLKVIPFELSLEETEALVRRCKQEAVTVQSALCAAFASPFAERQPDRPVRCIETPINLRNRLLRPLENTYGVYISLVYTQVDCSPNNDKWDIARQVSHDLARVTDEQLFKVPIVMMQVADRPPAGPVATFDYDLSISNLGRVNIPAEYGSLTLESVYGPTMNVSERFHRILGVSTFGGRMRCTYTSRDPQSPELARRGREILAEMIK